MLQSGVLSAHHRSDPVDQLLEEPLVLQSGVLSAHHHSDPVDQLLEEPLV